MWFEKGSQDSSLTKNTDDSPKMQRHGSNPGTSLQSKPRARTGQAASSSALGVCGGRAIGPCRKRLSAGPRAVRSLPGRGHRLGAWQGDWWLRARYRCFGHRYGVGFLPVSRVAGLTPTGWAARFTYGLCENRHRCQPCASPDTLYFPRRLRYQRPHGKDPSGFGLPPNAQKDPRRSSISYAGAFGHERPDLRRCSSSRRELRVARAHHL